MSSNKKTKILSALTITFTLMGTFTPLLNVVNTSVVYAGANAELSETKVLKYGYDEKNISLGKTLTTIPVKKGISRDKVVTYTSSNPDVALIDEKGKVTAMSRGTSVITAAVDGLTASYTLKVSPGKISMYDSETDEKMSGTAVIPKHEKRYFYIQDEYNSILDSEVKWTSSKENVCTVSGGTVIAVGDGSSTITASMADNEKSRATLRVNVKTPVEEIAVDDYVSTYVGESVKINYVVLPEDATSSRLKFEIEDKNIATVTSTGEVKGKEAGSTYIKVSSVSNPEIQAEVELEVKEERDYRTVKISDIIDDVNSDSTLITSSDGSYRVEKNETISIPNDYGDDATFKNNNEDIIKVSADENLIKVKGIKDGAATITANYSGMKDTVKVISGKYIDKSVLVKKDEIDEKTARVEKIKQVEDPDDATQTIDYVNDYPLEVGTYYDLKVNISPINASTEDLVLELSDTKNFTIENGKIKANAPNKRADLKIYSKSNSKVSTTIKLKSSIGNVEAIAFVKSYIGANAFDINKYKTYSFNPIFYMESGKEYNPAIDPEIVNDEIYKALKKNIKITTEDKDVIDVSSNKVKPKKGVDGTGILKIEYDKKKNSRTTENSEDITAEINFESIGVINETIREIKFAKSSYDLSVDGTYEFNPIFILSEGTRLDPTKDEKVVETEKYQQLLNEVGLLSGTESGEYVDAVRLLNFNYLENGNTNNSVKAVYEGKCKIKMVVHSDNNISAETTINIRSPYVLKNMADGVKVSKEYKKTMYVNTDTLKIVDDVQGNGESGSIPRSTAIWAFEKYSNGYMRVSYNGNENLYVESKYLSEKKESTIKKEEKKTTTSTSTSSSSSKKNNTSSSSSSSSSSNKKNNTTSSSSSSNKKNNTTSSSNNTSSKRVYINGNRVTKEGLNVVDKRVGAPNSKNYIRKGIYVYVQYKEPDIYGNMWAYITSPFTGWVYADSLAPI